MADLWFDNTSKVEWDFGEPNDEPIFHEWPKQDSNWECYMYGSKPGKYGSMVYYPSEGQIPNWFARYFMKVFLGCTWVKKK